MKNVWVLLFFFLAMLTSSAYAQNIGALLRNKALVTRQINCVLQKGPCDIIGKQIRAALPEALNNDCRRCTPEDALMAVEIKAFVAHNYPREWNQIVKMWGNRRV